MRNSCGLVLQAWRRASATLGLAFLVVVVLVLGTVITQSAHAQTYKESVLYSFTGAADGANPEGGVIFDQKGNLYGTTDNGGGSGWGVAFKLSSKGKETVLHSFTLADGASPLAGLIFDGQGNLYGTTNYSTTGTGIVFKLGKYGKETVLCSFTGGAGGEYPYAGLIFDAQGNLYSTAAAGGASGTGVVFKLGKYGKETVLYSFTGGADGANPYAGLIFDAQGNLYGTTVYGGDLTCPLFQSGCGTVFKLGKHGKETVLHSFTGGADGASPYAGLIFDAQGNLYGTTNKGGASGAGVVFKLGKYGKETVLYSFTGGADGANPYAGLIFDAQGNLYGTTNKGGASGAGVVFKLGLGKNGKETVLYSFTGGADGANPYAGLIFDAQGNLYGTTRKGGASDAGTVFKLTP